MDWRRFLFLPPIAVGVLGYIALTMGGDAPPSDGPAEAAVPVRTLTLAPTAFQASATGFGRVEAERSWSAISQVSGRVAEVADALAVGRLVDDGAVLIEIERRDYEIAVSKAEANLASARAALEELDVEESNTQALLGIEKRVGDVARADFERQSELARRGTVSAATLDAAERTLLNQDKVVLELENRLRLFPVQRVSLEETIRTRTVELEEAQRDLANTVITAPFAGRVSEKTVALAQFVRDGDALLTLEDIATVEVVAEFQPRALSNLIVSHGPEVLTEFFARSGTPRAVDVLRGLGLTATVRAAAAGEERFVEWEAEIVRFTGQVDEATGTFGIAVQVEDPLRVDLARRRPPLNAGTFVEVLLEAAPQDRLVAPRSAIRTDPAAPGATFVHLVGEDERLARAEVTLGPSFGDETILVGGVAAGDRIVLSDLNPAIAGMRLLAVEPTSDPDPTSREQAGGAGAARAGGSTP